MKEQYMERPVGTLSGYKFTTHIAQCEDFRSMPKVLCNNSLRYMLNACVGDYILLAIPSQQEQMVHVWNAFAQWIFALIEQSNCERTIQTKAFSEL